MRHEKRDRKPAHLVSTAVIPAATPLLLTTAPPRTAPDKILAAIAECDRHESFIAFTRYTHVAHFHATIGTVPPALDKRLLDDFSLTSVELSAVRRTSKTAADATLAEALAMEFRIPLIGECLRDGCISPRQFQRLVTFTDLIEHEDYAGQVDAAIAAELRRHGTWSDPRLRDLVDRIICRHDPDAVRRRSEAAKKNRDCHPYPLADGMAELRVSATPEDIELAMDCVRALASTVCKHDPRAVWARRSDAAISRLQGIPFECQCDRPDCTSITKDFALSERHARIAVHVVCGCGTLDDEEHHGGPSTPGPDPSAPVPSAPAPDGHGPGTPEPDPPQPDVPESADRPMGSDAPGFLNGYGIISGQHVRDIAARPDAVVRPLNHPGERLPAHLPSDPYRFSQALDTFIRARDGYCVFPGCPRPAWACDLDHVTEYDHRNPARGGQSSPINGNPKCRFHHLAKTFTEWLDDQYRGADGLTHTEFRSPHGLIVEGHGHTNEILFPGLRNIEFNPPPPPPAGSGKTEAAAELRGCGPPQRHRTRAAEKLARRRRERKLNRRDRLAREERRQHPAASADLAAEPDF